MRKVIAAVNRSSQTLRKEQCADLRDGKLREMLVDQAALLVLRYLVKCAGWSSVRSDGVPYRRDVAFAIS